MADVGFPPARSPGRTARLGSTTTALGGRADAARSRPERPHLRIGEIWRGILGRYDGERHRLLVELCPDALFIHSRARIVFMNAARLRLLGADAATVLLASRDGTELVVRASDDAAADASTVVPFGCGIAGRIAAERAPTAFADVSRADVLREGAVDVDDTLTAREREVLLLAGEGSAAPQIGERLGSSARTAEAHRAHVMQKLGLRTKAELIRYPVRRGLPARAPDAPAES